MKKIWCKGYYRTKAIKSNEKEGVELIYRTYLY